MATIPVATAMAYLAAGLSCLPAAKARKHPAIGSWKNWQTRLPTEVEVRAWFSNPHDAICVVAGSVSGNLECLDFDNGGELFAAWIEKVDTGLLAQLVIEQTPSGGYHVCYRVAGNGEQGTGVVDGNLKLARGIRDGKQKTLIETRGEGGLFLCAPTEGYSLQQGDFAHLPTIAPDTRQSLLDAARSLDELPAASTPTAPAGANVGQPGADFAPAGGKDAFDLAPGDDFNARGDIHPLLEAAGWQFAGNNPDGNELWTRPGKDPRNGISATYKDGSFYVFSSNAAPFEPNVKYSPFAVYATLHHNGDYTAAASALLTQGYGRPKCAVDGVTLNLGSGKGTLPVNAAGQPKRRRHTLGELVEAYPKMKPPLIHGFLRIGETMNIIAPPKTGKSWLVTDLALSVATGMPWFGFPCEQGKVLIIDNELHSETSANRIPKVVESRGVPFDLVKDEIVIENQRGSLGTIEDLGREIEELKPYGFKLVIVDAFYRALPRGTDENDNGTVAGLYNLIDKYAEALGCAFVLIHHTSKGNQSQKSVTDVGAGAGSQSRAADAHVILRHHKEKGCVVMESVVRSFPSVEPVCLRWNWPLWNRDDNLNPEDLDGKAEPKMPKRGVEAAVETDMMIARVRELVNPKKPESKTTFISTIERSFDVSRTKARLIFDSAIDFGYIKCERLDGVGRAQNSTKFVLLGDASPDGQSAQEGTVETADDED